MEIVFSVITQTDLDGFFFQLDMVCMHTISCIQAASFCCLDIHRLRCRSQVQLQDEEMQDALPGGMSVVSYTHPPRYGKPLWNLL